MERAGNIWRVFCILLLIFDTAVAQNRVKQFRNISLEQGLSQSNVFAITQDTLGFMWVGTGDGLNRYDSRNFKVYRPSDEGKSSILSSYIRSLFIDHKGNLWAGGNKGISRYDYKTDGFVNFKLPRSNGEWYICSITEDLEGGIWTVSITGDIFYLKPGAERFALMNLNTLLHGIRKIAYIGANKGELFLGTDIGLFKINQQHNNVTKIDIGTPGPVYVNEVFFDEQAFWIGTEHDGLIMYKTASKQSMLFKHQAAKNSLADNSVRCIRKDETGNIWLATFKGLSILKPADFSFQNYYHEISQPFTIGQNSVRCLYIDKQKGMWLGTYNGGLSYYHKEDIKFNLLGQNRGNPSLSDQVVSVIKQDQKGDFWIGTNNKGLNYWNPRNHTISYFSSQDNNPASLSSNNVKSIAFDDKGNVLIGTVRGGLNILNPGTGKIKRFLANPNSPGSIAGDLVYSVLKDYKGRIWVGTRSGLDQFIPASQQFKHISLDNAGQRLVSDDITCMIEDSRHRIWIGTTNGVSLFYPDNLLFGKIGDGSPREDVVSCITEDQKKRIWIGTREGVRLYDEGKRSFITVKKQTGFPTGMIYGIQPDNDGNLWISTSSGLLKFNPDSFSFQTFGERDGLRNNQFNDNAYCKAGDGMLLFGGIKGISYFYPADFKQQRLPLKLWFTGLEVFNKEVNAGDKTGILTDHIDQIRSLDLPPEYKQFSISFNAFNYISSGGPRYYYKLEGIDKTWQNTEQLKVSYSNLPHGNYKLRIKAVGPNGESSAARILDISILPPWYKTGWFYFLMFTILCTAGYMAYRIITERIKAQQLLKLERMDRDKVQAISKVKMDFFTNISHELRTPLTLILAPLEELLKKPLLDRAAKKKLELMNLNAKRLYNLVDQLFEFRKTEMGTRRLKVTKNDIIGFVLEIYESFKPLSEKKVIKYSCHSAVENLSFYFDRDAIEKILFNLLSNAFKYTDNGGEINLRLYIQNDQLIIAVEDSGVGIDGAHLDKIFDSFYQVNTREINLGSGVGLAFTRRLIELHHGAITVESKLGKGSIFHVAIPIGDQFYRNDQCADVPSEEFSIIPGSELPKVEPPGEGMKILIVDDNQEILDYMQGFFSESYLVSVANDGKMALEMLEDTQFDVIISDVMMPELDGLHFCKRVKQNINTSHIPVILLTAKTETSQHLKGLEMGADDYVTKPFSPDLLALKVANLLRSRKRLKEYYLAGKEIIPENIAFNTMDEEFLKKAIAIISANLSDSEFSVDVFTREMAMSRSKLYVKLKAITGEPVKDFIKRIRFNHAVELMKAKGHSIAQIAYMCGFNTPSYFSTAFKQYYGVMPSEYLEKEEGAER